MIRYNLCINKAIYFDESSAQLKCEESGQEEIHSNFNRYIYKLYVVKGLGLMSWVIVTTLVGSQSEDSGSVEM